MSLRRTSYAVSLLGCRLDRFAAMILGSLSLHGGVLSGPIDNPANGHSYYLLNSNTWTASQAEAVTLGGNLVTINDGAENDWVFDTFSAGQRNLWIGLYDPALNGVYNWVDGTAVSYSNWDIGPSPQPDGGDEHWVFMAQGDLGHGLTARKWHDVLDNPASAFPWIGPLFGVAETLCIPHRASATARVDNGFVVDATIINGGCGYTNAPLIIIIVGGGGSGATAAATITNGVVSGITITDAGIGYTNAPKVLIASPPFMPWLEIGVSKVKVTQHVVLGKNYVLESSTDLTNWSQVGTQFTAQDEVITQEFDVDVTGRFFRIRQVP